LELLAKDPGILGESNEFLPLVGQCFNIISNEKEYKSGSFDSDAKDFEFEICLFEDIKQRKYLIPNSNEKRESFTTLGVWSHWQKNSKNITSMIYTNGDPCWNGPNRIVNVFIECGSKNFLQKVIENGKCYYEMWFVSPSVCDFKYGRSLLKKSKQFEEDITLVSSYILIYLQLLIAR
jgi:hypothetical protein